MPLNLRSPPLIADDFNPRCDTIPIANLLANNYNWMNHSTDAVPHRIARLLRQWARPCRATTSLRALLHKG